MVRSNRIARIVTASILASVLAGFGATAYAAPEAAPQTQVAPAKHGHHHRPHGDLLRAALRLESLSATQRQQIEGLVAQGKAAKSTVHEAKGQLMEQLANGVAAGKVDGNAVAPKVQAVESAIQANEPGERASLEKLHQILTPAQRTELVTRIESHQPRGPRPDHASPNGGERGEHGGFDHGRGGPMGGLNLTDAQKQQIWANVRAAQKPLDKSVMQEAHESHKRVLEAFKNDRFVMNEIAPAKDPRIIDAGVERMVTMAQASATVLTPEQRAIAAAKLRGMANHTK